METEKSHLRLEEIIPENPDFTVGEQTHRLRIPNLDDNVWFQNQYGSLSGLQEIFREMRWSEIGRIAWHLLEDRTAFQAVKETTLDENGVSQSQVVSGPRVLLRSMNAQEGLTLYSALTTAFLRGNPVGERLARQELQKRLPALTGVESSTVSPTNTAGPSSTSEAEASGRSPSH